MGFRFIIVFFLFPFLVDSFQNIYDLTWTKTSWRGKVPYQIPDYPSPKKLEDMVHLLEKQPPLIFVEEADQLQRELIQVAKGNRFLFIGGDCAESISEFSVATVKDYCKFMLQIGVLISMSTGLRTVKIGRIAGQFAKPRSQEFENVDGKQYLSYRGDIINDRELESRTPCPKRMLAAYVQAVGTLNLLRAFTKSGFASLDSFADWYIDSISFGTQRKIFDDLQAFLTVLQGFGVSPMTHRNFQETILYSGHECLLLPYEEAFTRLDPRNHRPFACSGHFLWLGERTRKLDAAQVEYLRGIHNPIGIKVSHQYDSHELLDIIQRLNPSHQMGKIVIMTRFGAKHVYRLPKLIKLIQEHKLNVVWVCDPMHANTYELSNVKTRSIRDIQYEIEAFFRYHHELNTIAGGIHLEMTPSNVSEVVSSKQNYIDHERYTTQCDPRLNGEQTLEVVQYTVNQYNRYKN